MELSELIHLYRGPLVGLLVSWGVPWSDADDIAQEGIARRNYAFCFTPSEMAIFGTSRIMES